MNTNQNPKAQIEELACSNITNENANPSETDVTSKEKSTSQIQRIAGLLGTDSDSLIRMTELHELAENSKLEVATLTHDDALLLSAMVINKMIDPKKVGAPDDLFDNPDWADINQKTDTDDVNITTEQNHAEPSEEFNNLKQSIEKLNKENQVLKIKNELLNIGALPENLNDLVKLYDNNKEEPGYMESFRDKYSWGFAENTSQIANAFIPTHTGSIRKTKIDSSELKKQAALRGDIQAMLALNK